MMPQRSMDVSKRLVLVEGAEVMDANNPDHINVLEKEQFSLLKFRSKMVTITPFMREILEAFKAPRTPNEVAKQVSEANHCSVESIVPALASFLNRMIKLGALALEETNNNRKRATTRFDNWQAANKFKEFTLLDQIWKKNEAFLFKCCKPDEPDTLYTLKILLNKKSSSGFQREMNILNSIPRHRNIRRCIYASPFDEEYPYLLLEYIEGTSISDHAIKNEASLQDKCKIIHGILSCIDHLHQHNILHGDIHSSNFLVDADNEVHLIDLGMSHHAGEETAGHGGIARYMAPERLPNHNLNFSKGQGDFLSEIFQLGICLYLLLSGNYPFKAFLLRDLTKAIQLEPPPPLEVTQIGESIPELLSNIVFKALEKKPADRYQSVNEMLTAWDDAVKATFNNIRENIEFKYTTDAFRSET